MNTLERGVAVRRQTIGISQIARWIECLVFALALALLMSSPAKADKRVALVVGNSSYRSITKLDNPRNDASLMAETLRSVGFELVGGQALIDLDKASFDTAVQNFSNQLTAADVALFYYAGHGVQVRGSNYMVPVGANPAKEADVDFQMVDVALVLRQMEGSGTRLNLVILDACRNNPLAGRGLRSAGGGLAQMRAPEGTMISYATQPGNVAQDGDGGNSPYTKALAQTIRRAGLDVFQTFNEVGLAVKRSTGGEQQPWVSSSPIDGKFYFVDAPAASTSPSASAPSATNEAAQAWSATKETTNPAVLEAFIQRYSASFYANLARGRLDELKASANGAMPNNEPHGIKTPAMKGDASENVAPVAQRVVLYEEDPANPKGKQYVGSVIWRTEQIKATGSQKPDIAVRADIEIPDRKFKMTMSFRRNTDTSLPASHTAELTFILPPDFAGGGVSNVPGILMKSNEQARGAPLAGLAAKVTDGFFLVGLSNVDADRARNLQLFKERSWFDVPLVYANQRRAIIAVEKGASGERAFKDALTAWGEDYPTASTFAQTRVQNFERTAASDARTSVQTYYSLTPDCNQLGTITVRVLKQPSQGTLEIARDRGFTNYAADNIRAKCNAQEVELTRVWYKSNADFKGRDQAQLEAFFTSGTSIKTTLQITVK
jgi:Caspase domain